MRRQRKPDLLAAPDLLVAISGTVSVPAPGEGKRGRDGHLGYLLRQANAATRLALERALADLRVTSAQFLVLTLLNAYPGISGADLARLALLTPQTVNLIVRNLGRMGAIAKQPHPVHGRILRLTVTPAGKSLLLACKVHADAVERQAAAGLSPAEEQIIRDWLVRLAQIGEIPAEIPDARARTAS